MSTLHDLYYPKSVAIIGASPNLLNMGSAFFIQAIIEMNYDGKVYYVNPKYKGQEINGEKIIGSLDDLDERIDVVYSCIRASLVPDLLRQCVRRKDKFFICFTSGFSEILTEDAIALEKELLSIIEGSSTRIVGPNCLGPYNPVVRIGWNTGISANQDQRGNVAFASQSGGHASGLLRVTEGRGFYYTLGLSFGNQIDINCLDVLTYYASHEETEVIALYLEDTGSASGSDFFKKLREVTPLKPVIIWKGGQTSSGARAAASHTGAIGGSYQIWKSMTKQAGGIFVEQSEEFWDIIHLLSIFIPQKKMRMCKSLGLIIPGGGNSVEATDLFTQRGFNVPVLSLDTQQQLSTLMPSVNTSFKNPVDLGASGTIDRVFLNSIKYVSNDPSIDIVINYQPLEWIVNMEERFAGSGYPASIARSLGRVIKKIEKPLIHLTPILSYDTKVAEIFPKFIEILRKRGIPHFLSMERLAVALTHLNEYIHFLNRRK